MPTIKLTQPAVERLKPPRSGRVEYWDSQLPGFGLRISATGRKSWVVMYRVGGKLVRETLGSLAVTPKVSDARELARASLSKAQAGTNPIEERRAAQQAEAQAAADTFRAVSELYVERYAKKNTKPATWKEVERQLRVDVFPKWGDRPIGEIRRRDVIELLDGIADRGSPIQANRTFARLRTLFNWALDREIIITSPVARMKLPRVERARSRVLTDVEIRLFWRGCDKLGWPFGPMYRVLLLTAQRRTEVAGVAWSEIDLKKGTWTMPRHKAKNDREHEVHLSALAKEIIEGLPVIGEGSGLVFTTTGQTHVSGYSKSKARLDGHMLNLLRTDLAEAGKDPQMASIEEWNLHDLRRTAATGMARLNVLPHVVDRILNHVSGTIRGVAAVYNRHSYLEERKGALEAWGRYVENLVRPVGGNVVELATALTT
jgi:integrase